MDAAQPTLRIASTWPPPCARHGPETTWIFCPWLQGLPRRTNLWIASLPIHDANAVLLDAIASDAFRNASLKPAFVGVCLVDPFRQLKHVFRTLAAAGVAGVVNLPTTGAFRGSMARALDDLGTGVTHEIAMLALARDQGLRIGGVAMTLETGARLIDNGCDFVLNLRFGAGTGNEVQSVVCRAGHPEYMAAVDIELN
ncbi:phosphoenolpyruvate hydrolase family protein [Microvirga calopogonii]|uniref:phosphoenolpyruvate hydrolase family protein n=1 Tax=Microvirga calopogonii TaxID=2078013 RepID=UPI000E0DC79F|nr:phosphoenolpyruvate hydrolase family protein [Microvirga calopogonii]